MIDQTAQGQTQIVYTVDMDNDLIEQIEFSGHGLLRFSYLDDVESISEEFTEPVKRKVKNSQLKNGLGMLWLIELAQGTLGNV